jgi:WD40 repeat protein
VLPGGWSVFAPDARRVLTFEQVSMGSKARVWGLGTGNELFSLSLEFASIDEAQFTSDGRRILTVSSGKVTGASAEGIHVWEAEDGKEIHHLEGKMGAFDRDGKRVATIDGHMVKIWDTETGNMLASLGHVGGAVVHGFSPDGRFLATSSEDGTVHLWDVEAGKEVFALRGERFLQFSPDSRSIATTGENLARIRPTDPLAAAMSLKPRDLTPEEREYYESGAR